MAAVTVQLLGTFQQEGECRLDHGPSPLLLLPLLLLLLLLLL
jgi:hypothetical protein